MTSKPAFKTTFAIIITAIFGYIMYLLIDSVNTGLFFADETGKDGPYVRKRKNAAGPMA